VERGAEGDLPVHLDATELQPGEARQQLALHRDRDEVRDQAQTSRAWRQEDH
jgi:hypothetical protein